MKIKIEGRFSEIHAFNRGEEREYMSIDDKSSSPTKPSEQVPSQKPKEKKKHSMMKKFKDYVNHSRSPFSLDSNGIFSGGYEVLKSMAKSFEKSVEGAKVEYTIKVIEGEYVPVVTSVTYKGGEG